jgi:hypothetical protein
LLELMLYKEISPKKLETFLYKQQLDNLLLECRQIYKFDPKLYEHLMPKVLLLVQLYLLNLNIAIVLMHLPKILMQIYICRHIAYFEHNPHPLGYIFL